MGLPTKSKDADIAHLSTFDECHRQQFGMCNELEAMADALPAKLDTLAAMKLAQSLRATLRRCHRKEEAIIFPVLLVQDPKMRSILERLRSEHLEDQDHASDIKVAIKAYVTDSKRKEAEELGYMLRCLFVSLRRHLAFDRDFILPLYLKVAES